MPDVPHSDPSLLRNRSFHLLWLSTFMAGFGDRLAMFAVQRLMGFGGGHEEASLAGGTDFFFFLPYVFFGPIAGWMGDTLSRKWIAVFANGLRGLIVLMAVVALPIDNTGALGESDRWMGWTLMLLIGVCAATFAPVKMSMVPNLVGYNALQRANAVVVNIGVIGNLFGAMVGGAVAGRSLEGAVATSAVAYLLSGFLLIFLRQQQHVAGGDERIGEGEGLGGLLHGVRYVLTHRPIWTLTILAMLIWGGTSVYLPALAALAGTTYGGHANAQETFGILQACLGSGMLVAGLMLGIINTRLGSEFQISFGLLGAALALTLQTLVPDKHAGMFIAFFGGFNAGMVLVALNTVMQRITPDYIRSRVFGAMEMLAESSKVVTSAAVWVAAEKSNEYMVPLTLSLGLLLVVVGGYAVWRYVLNGPAPSKSTNFLWRFVRFYAEAMHRLKARGKHRVPRSGPVILVSNHTAGLDPLLIQASSMRVICWMMASEYRLKILNFLWKRVPTIGVNRRTRDAASLKAAISYVRSGNILAIFPEGGINRERGELRPFNPGVAMLAQTTGASVVPVYITGTPNTASTFGSYARPSRSRLVYGEAFTVPRDLDREAALALIRSKIEALRSEVVT